MKKLTPLLFILALILGGCTAKVQPSDSTEPLKHKSPFEGTPGYILKFNKNDFKTGLNPVGDFGISVVIAVDISGSMADRPRSGGDAKYLQSAAALKTVANFLENIARTQKDLKVQVALMKFDDFTDLVMPLTLLNEAGIALLDRKVDPRNFEPNGGTAIGKAMEAGTEILAQSGTVIKSLIIVTDGENNVSPDPEDVMKAIYTNRNNISTEDMNITTNAQLTSFVGFDIQSPQFGKFRDLGARITSADNQEEIEKGLRSFLEADIKGLENK
jgi:von Willebrand factor type A domain